MLNLEQQFKEAVNKPSSINEHLPTLLRYGKKCKHITELGVRGAKSTLAWLYSNPSKLICYDIRNNSSINSIGKLAASSNIDFTFHEKNVLEVEIEKTDLLFIDTLHSYGQLKKELELHSSKVRKYIILHDTTSFEYKNEDSYLGENVKVPENLKEGLWPAVEEFTKNSDWFVEERYFNNNGLTILSRKSGKKYFTNSADNRIILVGGGPSVLECENGSVIDSFDRVLRYSYFKTKGFEKFSGTKTDFWWTVNPYRNETIDNIKAIFTHSYEHIQSCKVFNSFKDKNKLIHISPDFSNTLTTLVPFPSSGLISIFWFLQFYNSVTITGFDWWKSSKQHYFNSQIRGNSHTPHLEKEIIDNLCDEGKVKILV